MDEGNRLQPVLAMVVPCYNEEEVLEDTTDQLVALLKDLIREGLVSNRSFIVFVDDGSKGSTRKMIEEQSLKIPYITSVKLAANAGHQNALLAGLNSVIARYHLMLIYRMIPL